MLNTLIKRRRRSIRCTIGSRLYSKTFTDQLSIQYPLIGGPMYPCSNPELVAAVSNAGGIGVLQPISLTYVYGHDFREGIRYIKSLTDKPIGMNALIEKSSKKYQEKMEEWVDVALEEGVQFFITSLGKPDWVVEKAHRYGAVVYHDVTDKKWAEKALCVDGFIAVNNTAGGHAGSLSRKQLYDDLKPYGKPIICAGGIGDEDTFKEALDIGYDGVQLGTRFIASKECKASEAYKQAILKANEEDIVLTEKITGVPVSIINSSSVSSQGVTMGKLGQALLNNKKTKHLMRTILALRSVYKLKKTSLDESGSSEYWQAGKSVRGIKEIETVDQIVKRFAAKLDAEK
eukprot:TRINITY_DN9764_c0_g1_i1.p1 TRINITY_DN9764_c0_g1~~TRINITY_DN9764_c0_g1_i1.p1  ORF type:complete len:345 (-),score=69.64 TRINITY_DN9764_c0_g1_i1:84-1118(-)